MTFEFDPDQNQEYLQFDYGRFNILQKTTLILTGKFSLNPDQILHFGNQNTEFKFYNLIDHRNWVRERNSTNAPQPFEGLVALGPNFSWKKFKARYPSHPYPQFSSFLLNHKTNETSGNLHLTNDQKKQDLKILANFYAHLLVKSPFSSELPQYNLITVVPPKPNYKWNNSDVVAEEISKVIKKPFKMLLKRVDTNEKRYDLVDPTDLGKNYIILIDDIVKNRQTKTIISNILKSHQCPRVFVLTLGYTLLEESFPDYL